MAVYTHVGAAEMRALIAEYDIGDLISFKGIADGVENTNYDVAADGGRFVLTLFEKRVRRDDLPFFISLMDHLAAKGAPAPSPVAGRDGSALRSVAGRPAALVAFLPGAARMTPSTEDCRALGAFLARLHGAVADFPLQRANDLALDGWSRLALKCAPRADECAAGLRMLVEDELGHLRRAWPQALPQGVVHADLFPDNIFFNQSGDISGVIDFYFACTDNFAYDLAICLNSWAQTGGRWSAPKAAALVAGYESERALTDAERAAMPVLLRGAALRFLLTRLHDFLHQVEGAIVRVKDPLEYRDLLLLHRASPALWKGR